MIPRVPKLAALDACGASSDDVTWMIPHQANSRIIESTAKKTGLPMEKVVMTVQDHGNTSAASIPLALSCAIADGRIRPGQLLLRKPLYPGSIHELQEHLLRATRFENLQ